VREGQTLTITSASMKKKDDGAMVALLPVLDKRTDANGSLQGHEAVLMPATSLLPDTEYIVTVAGSSQTANDAGSGPSGTNPAIKDNSIGAFSKSFTFRTGS